MNEPERSIAQAVEHLMRATRALLDITLSERYQDIRPDITKARDEIQAASEQLKNAWKSDAI